jgi:hypothetical protein
VRKNAFTRRASGDLLTRCSFSATSSPCILVKKSPFFPQIDRKKANFPTFGGLATDTSVHPAENLPIHQYVRIERTTIQQTAGPHPHKTDPICRPTTRHSAPSPPLFPVPCPLSTVHCRLSTVHCRLSSVPCPLFTVHCPLSTVPCPLFPVHCSLFPVHCSLFPVHCSLFPVHCPLFPVHCSLFTVHCPLSTVDCPLFTVHCSLSTVPTAFSD